MSAKNTISHGFPVTAGQFRAMRDAELLIVYRNTKGNLNRDALSYNVLTVGEALRRELYSTDHGTTECCLYVLPEGWTAGEALDAEARLVPESCTQREFADVIVALGHCNCALFDELSGRLWERLDG